MANAIPDFYRAATMWLYTRCAECDGRGYFHFGLGPRRTCQTCHGEGTVSVPAFPHYLPIPNRKPKTMADASLAPSRPLVTCPCCHGQKHLLISVPCLHCEETGTVQAEVVDLVTIPLTTDVTEPPPTFLRDGFGRRTDVTQTHDPDVVQARSAAKPYYVTKDNVGYVIRSRHELPIPKPRKSLREAVATSPKPPSPTRQSSKSPKRSRPRTRNARNERNG